MADVPDLPTSQTTIRQHEGGELKIAHRVNLFPVSRPTTYW